MAREPAVQTRLARLRRESDIDRGALEQRAAEIDALAQQDALSRAELVLLAANLHGYYTGLETLLERVARLLDDDLPSGPGWHAGLIEQMQTDVPGLRQAIVPPVVADDLHELRKFRHFFRNAYVLEFDRDKLAELAQRLGRVHAPLRASLVAFRDHLSGILDADG